MLNFLTLSITLSSSLSSSTGIYPVKTNLKSTYGKSFTSSSGTTARTTSVLTNKGAISKASLDVMEAKVTGDINFELWNKTGSTWSAGTVITANFSSTPLIFGVI